jgi:hypothetical protein
MQMEFVSLEQLVPQNHTYRKLKELLDFSRIIHAARIKESSVGAIEEILRRGLHPMIILRNNMKDKNPDLDHWITKLRCPYERVFSKQNKRVRYKGTEKNQGAEFLYAMAFNFRRLLKLEAA